MRKIIVFCCALLLFGCADRLTQEDVKRIVSEMIQPVSMQDFFEAYGADSLMAEARVRPYYYFNHWNLDSISGDTANRHVWIQGPTKDVMISIDTLARWILDSVGVSQTLSYSNDTLTISNGNSVVITGFADSTVTADAFITHLALITNNSDSLTTHRTEINDILDSLAAHRIDINAGGGFDSFYFNNGSTVTQINDGDTLTHVASGGSGVSTSGSISTAIQNMIDTFGVAAVYTQGDGTITRSNTTLDTTLHQYYVGFSSPTITYYGAQTLEVTALFSYVVGKTYYLQDNGRLDVAADDVYDSAVLNVVANPSGNNYIINLADPRHFLR